MSTDNQKAFPKSEQYNEKQKAEMLCTEMSGENVCLVKTQA